MSPRVLIVDDSLTETRIFKSVLEREGYQVSIAGDGQEGIRVAESCRPDVIIMDVVMPLVDGFQATRTLSMKETTAHIPIIVCSSKSSKTDQLWAKKQGAKSYLVKPVKVHELLGAIRQQVTGA